MGFKEQDGRASIMEIGPPILPHGRRGLTVGHAPAHAATLASMLDRGVAGPCRHAPPPAPRPLPSVKRQVLCARTRMPVVRAHARRLNYLRPYCGS
jgi:hypothetical protein